MTEKDTALEPTSDRVTAPSAPDPVGPITRSDGRGPEPSGVCENIEGASLTMAQAGPVGGDGITRPSWWRQEPSGVAGNTRAVGYDAAWRGVRFDSGHKLSDLALSQAYAEGYKKGRADAIAAKSSIFCVCCGDIMGPSRPHNETRCGDCRYKCDTELDRAIRRSMWQGR